MSETRARYYKARGRLAPEELRRRRSEESVVLRKAKKYEYLKKRRQIDTDEEDFHLAEFFNASDVILSREGVYHEALENVHSNLPQRQFLGAQAVRRMLSCTLPPIDNIIKANIVPKFIRFLQANSHPELQYESAWILTNIASGNSSQTDYVVYAGAIDPLIQILNSPYAHIVEQAIWALGNIAAEGPRHRDKLINKGILLPLITLARSQSSHISPSMLHNIAWTLSRLCSGHPPLPSEATHQCLLALADLIQKDDFKIIEEASWALSFLSDGPNEKIEDIVQSGVVLRLVQLLGYGSIKVLAPCLRTVRNIVTGNDSQTQVVLDAGVLPYLVKLLRSKDLDIVRGAVCTVAGIAAGTKKQINMLMEFPDVIPSLFNILHNGDFRSQKEAIWAIGNIAAGGTVDNLVSLGNAGMIQTFCALLNFQDWNIILLLLEGIENMLKGAEKVGQAQLVSRAIEDCGGLDEIEKLQYHENMTVYSTAYALLENYFGSKDDGDSDCESL